MRLTSAGQVSVPAEVRRRWQTTRVQITDHGDRIVIEPEPENPFHGLRGRFAGPGPTSDEMREQDRADEREVEERRWGR